MFRYKKSNKCLILVAFVFEESLVNTNGIGYYYKSVFMEIFGEEVFLRASHQ